MCDVRACVPGMFDCVQVGKAGTGNSSGPKICIYVNGEPDNKLLDTVEFSILNINRAALWHRAPNGADKRTQTSFGSASLIEG